MSPSQILALAFLFGLLPGYLARGVWLAGLGLYIATVGLAYVMRGGA